MNCYAYLSQLKLEFIIISSTVIVFKFTKNQDVEIHHEDSTSMLP